MEPSHIHTVTAGSDPESAMFMTVEYFAHPIQKLHKQPQWPTLKMKIFKRGRTDAKIADK